MKRILFLTLPLTVLMIGCGKTIGELSDKGTDSSNRDITQQPVSTPPKLTSFSCATGTGADGTIDCSLGFPANTDLYLKVDIMRVAGTFSNTENCLEGTRVFSTTDYSSSTYQDMTPYPTGEVYSYRACVLDKNDRVTSFLTSSSIRALDTKAPANLDDWTCSTGTTHGETTCTLDFPADTSDYASFSIRQIPGDTPPNLDCTSDGTEVFNLTTGFTDQTVNFATGANYGEAFSYRFCIQDTSANLNNGVTISNLPAFDNIAPTALDGFACVADTNNIQQINCNIDYPVNVLDYYRLEIRRLTGAVAPNADCSSDGTIIYSQNVSFTDTTINDDTATTPGNQYSYRVCIYDSSNNLEASTTQAAINTSTGIVTSFNCVTGSVTTGNIVCTIDFLPNNNKYSSIDIVRITGATAPNSDCRSDGLVVRSFSGTYTDQTFTDFTGPASGVAHSYRVCATSNNGRTVSSNQTVTNVLSF